MKLSERYDEIIGWNEDDGTTHIRNEVVKLEDENEAFRDECSKLKKHLGPDGEYCITRADKESMSWESLVVSDIFEKLDALLADIQESK